MSKKLRLLDGAAALVTDDLFYTDQGPEGGLKDQPRKVTAAALAAALALLSGLAVSAFTDLHTKTIPAGINSVQTAYHTIPGKGGGIYIENAALDDAAVAAHPLARVKTANNRYFELSAQQSILAQMFGAAANDDGNLGTDDAAAFLAARDWLQHIEINPSTGSYYAGTPPLHVLGSYYLNMAGAGKIGLEFFAGTQLIGHGSGRSGPGGGSASRLRFAAGSHGVIAQFPNTSGVTGVDVGVHKGPPGFSMRGVKIEGSFAGVEGDWHGFIPRTIVNLDDVYVYNWPGEGIKGWAGAVFGLGNISGNLSTSFFRGVKVDGCRGGADMRGNDCNVITWVNCEFYTNRWLGYLDDNGAGSNSLLSPHAASNGGITGAWAQTQCSYMGRRYAAAWGGDFTIAPSGDTSDTANWFFVEAGGVIANLIPAWTNVAGTFRAGGDYVTIRQAGVLLLNPYAEYGTFSQFNNSTRIEEGTLGDQYFRGGTRINSGAGGYRIRQTPNVEFILQHRSTEGDLLVEDEAGIVHSRILFSKTAGNFHGARDISGHVFQTAPYNGAWTTRCSITTNGVELPAAHAFYVNGLQVLAARQTGCPAAATDPASTMALANFLRTALLGHGTVSA